jgi:hypothetical protein
MAVGINVIGGKSARIYAFELPHLIIVIILARQEWHYVEKMQVF